MCAITIKKNEFKIKISPLPYIWNERGQQSPKFDPIPTRYIAWITKKNIVPSSCNVSTWQRRYRTASILVPTLFWFVFHNTVPAKVSRYLFIHWKLSFHYARKPKRLWNIGFLSGRGHWTFVFWLRFYTHFCVIC